MNTSSELFIVLPHLYLNFLGMKRGQVTLQLVKDIQCKISHFKWDNYSDNFSTRCIPQLILIYGPIYYNMLLSADRYIW